MESNVATQHPQQPKPKAPDEKAGISNFPSIPPQELHIFAMKIRIKDNTWIFDHVPANPRFLVSSTDYPTIIQAGFHYNALHMAARWGNFHVVQLVLSSISSAEFVRTLYPEDDTRSITKRVKFLTDMYLNTPETGAQETPLHIACKFSWYEVAKLLIGHPSIELTPKNDLKQTPEDIIGTRREDSDVAHKIRALFRNDVILPVWRDQFDSSEPVIGPVVNPKCLGEFTPLPFMEQFCNISMDLFAPKDKSIFPKSGRNNQWKVVGYAGPTDEITAQQLFNVLRRKDLGGNQSFNNTPPLFDTPPPPTSDESFELPRTPVQNKRASLNLPITSTPTRLGNTLAPLNQSIQELDESFKGLAIHTKTNSRRQSTPIRLGKGQYTPPRIGQVNPTMLGQVTPTRFGSKQHNLSLNNSLLDDDDEPLLAAFLEETIIRRTDPVKGIERIARRYAKELGVSWVEYWGFLDKFVDLGSEEGLSEVDAYFLRKEHLIEENAKYDSPNPAISKFESESADDDEEDRWYSPAGTPASSPQHESFDECFSYEAFVKGQKSSTYDDQLSCAVALVEPEVLEKYPALSRWFNLMKSLGSNKRIPAPVRY